MIFDTHPLIAIFGLSLAIASVVTAGVSTIMLLQEVNRNYRRPRTVNIIGALSLVKVSMKEKNLQRLVIFGYGGFGVAIVLLSLYNHRR